MSKLLAYSENDDYEDMDLKILNFIKKTNNNDQEERPEPTYFKISTQSAMCKIENANSLELSKIVVLVTKNILNNIVFKNNPDYLIRGIVVDNVIIRFDESHLKKYKYPIIKYFGNNIDINNKEECLLMYNNLIQLENNSLKKQGRQKKTKEIENFYNSCSIIVKASKEIKCVNIKLFNNGRITLTGSKNEFDGYHACQVLLEELKRDHAIFIDADVDIIKTMSIINYKITMINSDFDTNFKIDLIKLLTILNNDEKDLFTKFNPEKYRGLIIGFYWNLDKPFQDGKCKCTNKCNGKGPGKGDGNCKKITISIFKSGSIIITGGQLVKQIEDAYFSINQILKKYYHEIIKLSILDFMNDEDDCEEEEVIKDFIPLPVSSKKIKIKINKASKL